MVFALLNVIQILDACTIAGIYTCCCQGALHVQVINIFALQITAPARPFYSYSIRVVISQRRFPCSTYCNDG
jgi:hypothetical protein